VGHYVLRKTIGEGTFGKVKLGTHILTGEKVAVKILEKERIAEVADVDRVAREIHILKLVRHPHVVRLYEIVETPRQLYLVMEYCSRGELFEHIVARGRVLEPEACRFLHQILAGLEHLHSLGVAHRDLKPENLLLDDRMDMKIVDFGLSNTFQKGGLMKTACGSPCYAAPEMIAGERYAPAPCDIWSCGVVLFALSCGYLPFEDENTSELYGKILSANYEAPDFISEELKDLIARMLTVDPRRRYTVEQVRAHAWYRQIPEASQRIEEELEEAEICGEGSGGAHEEVLRQLGGLGFPREYAAKCLQMRKHNHATTTYHLLSRRRRGAAAAAAAAAAMDVENRAPGSYVPSSQCRELFTAFPSTCCEEDEDEDHVPESEAEACELRSGLGGEAPSSPQPQTRWAPSPLLSPRPLRQQPADAGSDAKEESVSCGRWQWHAPRPSLQAADEVSLDDEDCFAAPAGSPSQDADWGGGGPRLGCVGVLSPRRCVASAPQRRCATLTSPTPAHSARVGSPPRAAPSGGERRQPLSARLGPAEGRGSHSSSSRLGGPQRFAAAAAAVLASPLVPVTPRGHQTSQSSAAAADSARRRRPEVGRAAAGAQARGLADGSGRVPLSARGACKDGGGGACSARRASPPPAGAKPKATSPLMEEIQRALALQVAACKQASAFDGKYQKQGLRFER